eukprot:5697806-Amphidinium_carterae.1
MQGSKLHRVPTAEWETTNVADFSSVPTLTIMHQYHCIDVSSHVRWHLKDDLPRKLGHKRSSGGQWLLHPINGGQWLLHPRMMQATRPECCRQNIATVFLAGLGAEGDLNLNKQANISCYPPFQVLTLSRKLPLCSTRSALARSPSSSKRFLAALSPQATCSDANL